MRERLTRLVESAFELHGEPFRAGRALVCDARDREREQDVTLRVYELESGVRLDEAVLEREWTRAASLRHEHVRTPLSRRRIAGALVAVVPRAAGVTLRTWLARESCLPFLEAARVLRELASALEHAHAQGLVHLELVAENVFWSETHVLLDGLGCAAALARARGKTANLDPLVDLRAFGALAYELLAGRAPEPHPEGGVRAVNELRHHIPPGLARMIMRTLDPDPARVPSWRELRQLLDGLVTPPQGYEVPQMIAHARFHLRRGIVGTGRALACFDAARELAPSSASACAGAAETHALRALYDGVADGDAARVRALAEHFETDGARGAASAEARAAAAATELAFGWSFVRARDLAELAGASAPRDASVATWRALAVALGPANDGRSAERASDLARSASESEPSNAFAASTFVELSRGAAREAALACSARARLDDSNWDLHRARGTALGRLGRNDAARSELELALAASERHPSVVCARGVASAQSGDLQRARELLDELTLGGEHDATLGARTRVHAAPLLFALGRHDDALALLRDARAQHDPALVFVRVFGHVDELELPHTVRKHVDDLWSAMSAR